MQTARGASLSGADTDQDARSDPSRPQSDASPRRLVLLAVVAVVVLVADVVSKIEVVRHLAPGQIVKVVGSVLEVTLTRNPGAAFSIGQGQTVIFGLVAVAVVVAILRTARRLRSIGWAVTLGLLLGGALGNLTDRIFRAPGFFRGYVVDWIKLPHWPVFNLADSSIVVGGCLAVLLALRGVEIGHVPDPGRQGGDDTDPTPSR